MMCEEINELEKFFLLFLLFQTSFCKEMYTL